MIKKINNLIHHFLIDHFPKVAIKREWKLTFGYDLNLKNPKTLNEKIQWLIVHEDMKEWARLADKISVRDFVKERGHEDILTKLYGVWDKAENIDYNKLPDKFVIKCNHDCGSTHIIDKAKGFDKEILNQELNIRVAKRFGYESTEPHYTKIEPKIMAEEYIPLSKDINSSSQVDYKFWCFNGKIHHCFICYDRRPNGHASYDMYKVEDWTPCREGFPEKIQKLGFKGIPRPQNLEKMIKVAQDLSKGFPEIRVDLYNVNGKIYFGELTLSSAKGRMDYFSDSFQREMGDLTVLTKY